MITSGEDVKRRCEYSTVNVPNDASYSRAVAAYLGQVAEMMGFPKKAAGELKVGATKAFLQVIRSSFEPHQDERIEISCERIPEGLKVSIRDHGLPLALLGDTHGSRDPGIFHLREYLDEISYNSLGPEGNETVLVKHLPQGNPSDYQDTCEKTREDPGKQIRKPVSGYQVRAMEPEEALEVSRAIYTAYGYSYAHPYVYYPERLVELNRNGQMLSVVAVTEENEIAGYGALIFTEGSGKLAEMAQAVVKPEYRAQGILGSLTRYVIERAEERGMQGVYAQMVTVHTYSQKIAHRFGLRDCALILGYFPQSEVFKGIAEALNQRMAVILGFLRLRPSLQKIIYPPDSHLSTIETLYGEMGSSPLLGERFHSYAPSEKDSVIRTRLVSSMNFARIEVLTYGHNILKEIRSLLRELCLKRIDLVTLYLNLHDPGTHDLTGSFEEMGFFFAGILPEALPNGDALILQYLNNLTVNYGEIQVESDTARRMLSYVKSRDPSRR
jgi:anti-sigma regulatory factor (Ser/Thr protein kinase)/predicted N-acetyltransferase YhbS